MFEACNFQKLHQQEIHVVVPGGEILKCDPEIGKTAIQPEPAQTADLSISGSRLISSLCTSWFQRAVWRGRVAHPWLQVQGLFKVVKDMNILTNILFQFFQGHLQKNWVRAWGWSFLEGPMCGVRKSTRLWGEKYICQVTLSTETQDWFFLTYPPLVLDKSKTCCKWCWIWQNSASW